MRRLAVIVLLFCLPLLAQAQTTAIRNAEFGIFDASNPKETVFEPTLVVPHKSGQRYGWIIELKTAKRSVAVREEYLIESTETFKEEAGGQRLIIPQERRNQVSQRQLVPVDGRIYGEWAIGPREPPGKRRLQVLVEDQPPVVFEYEVR